MNWFIKLLWKNAWFWRRFSNTTDLSFEEYMNS